MDAPRLSEWFSRGAFSAIMRTVVGSMVGTAPRIVEAFARLMHPNVRVVAQTMPMLPKGPERRARERELGRACAAEALRQLGATDVFVGENDDRSPAWPRAFVGSITHTAAFVAVAAARAEDVRGLGVDAEETMAAETIAEVAREVATDDERARLEREGPARFPALFSALFSAKESLFKAVYPLERVWFDFEDAALAHVDGERLDLVLTRDVGAQPRGRSFRARWTVLDDHVLTAVEVGS